MTNVITTEIEIKRKNSDKSRFTAYLQKIEILEKQAQTHKKITTIGGEQA